VQIDRERGRSTSRVVQHEHPHAACLAVTARRKPDRRRGPSGCLELRGDRLDVAPGTVPEERERDMQVVGWDGSEPPVGQQPLPLDQGVHSLVGEPESAEETDADIAFDASSVGHSSL
jgi:hypothetical protein